MSLYNLSPSLPLVEEIDRLLGEAPPWDAEILGFSSVDSTNSVARGWAASGAPEGSLVIADHQTAGRGRLGRQWTSAPGQNLLFSIVLRPPLSNHCRGLVALTASVAVAEVLASVAAPYPPSIKWPNDILLDGRKCCGMLLETVPSHTDKRYPQGVILGIGLNVNQITFPPGIRDTATSLRLVTGQLIERASLFVQLVRSVHRWYDRLLNNERPAIRQAFEERMVSTGESVILRYTDDDSSIEGVVEGIDETGGLRLRHNGRCRTVHAGEVTFRRS